MIKFGRPAFMWEECFLSLVNIILMRPSLGILIQQFYVL